MVKYWEDLLYLNNIVKPWPVYMGLRQVVTANTEIHELVDATTFDAILICICHIDIPLQYKVILFLNIEGLLYFNQVFSM